MSICLVYSGFGFAMAGIEVASWFDPAIGSRLRALPKIFVAHALAGAVALLVGPLQFHGGLRRASLRIHRLIGRAYVYGVGISSVTAAYLVPAFDIPMAAKIAFGSLAVFWFATTTLGLQRAISGQTTEHQEWMLRSFSLSLFFVTGSLWMEISRSLPFAEGVTYPIAVLLGWALNLAIVEVWLRWRSGRRARRPRN